MKRIFFTLLTALLVKPVAAASFDCGEARTRVEKAVCADEELSRLDELLGRFYRGARQQLAENASCLETDQRNWLRAVRDPCANAACLKKVYLERLAELAALQPGMNIPPHFELPAYPALLWAIAPLPELKGAPRAVTYPLQVEGKLDFGCPQCGYFLRADGGRTYVLIPEMFLGGATATRLSVLRETSRDARLVARGFARTDAPRPAGFYNRHCVYLYLAP
jgi:uncharacterized protein YecT (DUF1311 family)